MEVLPLPSSDDEPLPDPVTPEMLLTPEKASLPTVMKARRSTDQQKKGALKDSAAAKTQAAKKKVTFAAETVPEDANPNDSDSATDDGTTATAKAKAKASRKRKAPPVSDEDVVATDDGPNAKVSRKRKAPPLSPEEKAARQAFAVEYLLRSTTAPDVDETYRTYSSRRLKELAIELPDQKKCHMAICALEWKKRPTKP